ncbi:MAG: ABC transporter ATP-binding protein [Desulfobacteraceae bacterium]|nr:ABC transporter ATP-binding protein [Desulfobacteraceae bacterium]
MSNLKNTENNSRVTAQSSEMICLDNISMCYRKQVSLLNLLFGSKDRKKQEFWALKDISFTLYKGETVGIIGRNGSGKSTLLMVCAKIYPPDKGKVIVNGKVQLLTLGLGFKNELTGRDNVLISSSLLGLSHSEIKERMPEIEDFADIGSFMDEPVRTYSSGMRSRLAFSIATAIQPDTLILDEVLTTGDVSFREKAINRMKNLQKLAKSAIIVSHNPNQLKQLCDRLIWIEQGRLIMEGEVKETLQEYRAFCKKPIKWMEENPSIQNTLNP